MINYHNKTFVPVRNTENGEVDTKTQFLYLQSDNIVTCSYSGGKIINGHLIAIVQEDGSLDMRYHQVNHQNQLMTGFCHSVPEIMPNGKIRLHETWQWTSGDHSEGNSILEEL